MKSYTDLEQSKKLAEILPLESADMCYLPTHIGDEHHFIASLSPYSMCTKMIDVSIKYCTPCWSLAALLGVLSRPSLHQTKDGDWYCNAEPNRLYFSQLFNNPIDACYDLILKLNELKML